MPAFRHGDRHPKMDFLMAALTDECYSGGFSISRWKLKQWTQNLPGSTPS
ncbi:MAG: hypothetical protein ACRC8Y_07125 [Chroococcales cyanobacterium]